MLPFIYIQLLSSLVCLLIDCLHLRVAVRILTSLLSERHPLISAAPGNLLLGRLRALLRDSHCCCALLKIEPIGSILPLLSHWRLGVQLVD